MSNLMEWRSIDEEVLAKIDAHPVDDKEERDQSDQNSLLIDLKQMERGGIAHTPWVTPDLLTLRNAKVEAPQRYVGLANEDDSYYVQYFKNREEIETFIGQLRAAADEAWPA